MPQVYLCLPAVIHDGNYLGYAAIIETQDLMFMSMIRPCRSLLILDVEEIKVRDHKLLCEPIICISKGSWSLQSVTSFWLIQAAGQIGSTLISHADHG